MSDNEIKDYNPTKAVVNATVQWPDLRLSEQIKHLRFFRDKDNNIVAMPVVMFDPTQVGLNVLPLGRVGISDPTALSSYARVFGHPCVGWPELTLGLVTHSTQMVQNCLTLEAQRTPSIWKTAFGINAGDVVVWDPTVGTRFRLLGGVIIVTEDAAAAAQQILSIDDGATVFFRAALSTGALVATGHAIVIPIDFGHNGYLSVLANNNLVMNLQANFTAGRADINVWGTEE